MPVVLAVANASGSAGKTTTVVSLADLIGRHRRVVVVDADAQATATSWLGHRPETVSTGLGEVLLKRAGVNAAVLDTDTPGVRVLPSNRSLDAATIELNTVIGREQRLNRALSQLAGTDVVLIDCPGSVSTITISALVTADAILTVTQPTLKEITGVPEMLDAVEAVRDDLNPKLRFAGVVPCIVPASSHGRIYSDAMALLHKTYDPDVAPPVRRSARVAEAHAQQVPLPTWSPRDNVTHDYEAVYEWLKARDVL